jgi:iron complex transport system substrate-binding protein
LKSTVIKVFNSKITAPWPEPKKILPTFYKKKRSYSDSIKQFTTIQIPIKSIVVTSTTHVPALEMLGIENTLVGFPNTDYISSEKHENVMRKDKKVGKTKPKYRSAN